MSEKTREQENRTLAEWLGWARYDSEKSKYVGRDWEEVYWVDTAGNTYDMLPDFRTDEAANAMLLDKILETKSVFIGKSFLEVFPDAPGEHAPEFALGSIADRKTAIVLAALKAAAERKD